VSVAASDKSTKDRQQLNADALLSTVGEVVLEKIVQGVWWAGLNWSAGRCFATLVLK